MIVSLFDFNQRFCFVPYFIGINQLIQVTCGEKQQFYCQLCSCRLLNSKHIVGETHQSNYVVSAL